MKLEQGGWRAIRWSVSVASLMLLGVAWTYRERERIRLLDARVAVLAEQLRRTSAVPAGKSGSVRLAGDSAARLWRSAVLERDRRNVRLATVMALPKIGLLIGICGMLVARLARRVEHREYMSADGMKSYFGQRRRTRG